MPAFSYRVYCGAEYVDFGILSHFQGPLSLYGRAAGEYFPTL